jgi:hypothetical protein
VLQQQEEGLLHTLPVASRGYGSIRLSLSAKISHSWNNIFLTQ